MTGRTRIHALIFAVCFFTFVFFTTACGVDERRSLPPAAQAAIDAVTDDISAGRDEKLYDEAAAEWRANVSADENKKILERVRTRLGKVESRAFHSGKEQQNASGRLSGHALEVVYQTTFERGTAMEKFTLLEREGRWLLAGYSVSSEALK